MSIQRKICLLGAFAVGKTSLVSSFVHQMFAEKYLTTVGVKIDTRTIVTNRSEVKLVVWDLAGEDDYHTVPMSYLRGCAGYLLVADGTRAGTLDTALQLHARVREQYGELPAVLVLNKCDLRAQWQLDHAVLAPARATLTGLIETSAKTGAGVDQAFSELARASLPLASPVTEVCP